ncbi:MAG: glutamate formimidoyltransferase, partial [Bacteroidota bacterium]
ELGIPVYLYERSATRPERRNLAEIRRGEFEGLREAIRDPARRPDFGPSAVHPGAGATVVGARPPLVAFNAYLDTGRLEVAKAVARAVRASSGGLAGVKALGLELAEQGAVQVSMNLVDTEATPIHRALELVKIEAARYGTRVVRTEIVGLVPLAALVETAEYYLQLDGFTVRQVLEARLREAEKRG